MIQFDYNNIFQVGWFNHHLDQQYHQKFSASPHFGGSSQFLREQHWNKTPVRGLIYSPWLYQPTQVWPGARLASASYRSASASDAAMLVGGTDQVRPGAGPSTRCGTPHLGRTFFSEADGSVFFLGGGNLRVSLNLDYVNKFISPKN